MFSAALIDIISSCNQAAHLARIHLERQWLPQWDNPYPLLVNINTTLLALSKQQFVFFFSNGSNWPLLKLLWLISNKWNFSPFWSFWWFFWIIQTQVQVPGSCITHNHWACHAHSDCMCSDTQKFSQPCTSWDFHGSFIMRCDWSLIQSLQFLFSFQRKVCGVESSKF